MKMKITYTGAEASRVKLLERIITSLFNDKPVRIRHTESGDGTLITYVRTIDKPRPGTV